MHKYQHVRKKGEFLKYEMMASTEKTNKQTNKQTKAKTSGVECRRQVKKFNVFKIQTFIAIFGVCEEKTRSNTHKQA